MARGKEYNNQEGVFIGQSMEVEKSSQPVKGAYVEMLGDNKYNGVRNVSCHVKDRLGQGYVGKVYCCEVVKKLMIRMLIKGLSGFNNNIAIKRERDLHMDQQMLRRMFRREIIVRRHARNYMNDANSLDAILEELSLGEKKLDNVNGGRDRQVKGNILQVDPRYLNANNELRRIFGSKVVDSVEKSNQTGSSRQNYQGSNNNEPGLDLGRCQRLKGLIKGWGDSASSLSSSDDDDSLLLVDGDAVDDDSSCSLRTFLKYLADIVKVLLVY
uniref:Uncharacterized protein n=1 Tax=Tanacetum cinerariifolium TaxID=118510 RepID=A0A6L2MZ06_TANCI|nr:hypothetical protein [Tanacetum cinerariifolium]